MAFKDAERTSNHDALRWFLDRRRPPEHIRPQLDIGYAITGQMVDIFEIRPDWQDETTTRHTAVARIRFVRTVNEWRLHWMRRDLKWHADEPSATHKSLRSALEAVSRDDYGCFFG